MKFETVWEKYECDKLTQKYLTKGTAFMQELMCDCQNICKKWFESIRVQTHKKLKHIIYKIVDRGGDIMNGKFSCFNSSNIITARIKEFDGNGKG